jgi:hypothetical protein
MAARLKANATVNKARSVNVVFANSDEHDALGRFLASLPTFTSFRCPARHVRGTKKVGPTEAVPLAACSPKPPTPLAATRAFGPMLHPVFFWPVRRVGQIINRRYGDTLLRLTNPPRGHLNYARDAVGESGIIGLRRRQASVPP